jgi:glycosyltransferase involved in cell wall biosynthesis
MNNDLVSVIMPVYNDERNLSLAISSVFSQTYKNWELLVIDDSSTDNSSQIISEYVAKDERIKHFKTEKPSGSPVLPRNIGIQHTQGRYIAFLDSDDQWMPTKLEHQIALFQNHPDAVIVFSNYKMIDEQGRFYARPIVAPQSSDYHHLLKGNVIGCLTTMYDIQKGGSIRFPQCGHEDYALLLSVLRNGGKAYNTNTIEAFYRLKKGSVSSNKFHAMRWQWHIYTEMEKLGIMCSSYYFVHYAVRAVNKRWWIVWQDIKYRFRF